MNRRHEKQVRKSNFVPNPHSLLAVLVLVLYLYCVDTAQMHLTCGCVGVTLPVVQYFLPVLTVPVAPTMAAVGTRTVQYSTGTRVLARSMKLDWYVTGMLVT